MQGDVLLQLIGGGGGGGGSALCGGGVAGTEVVGRRAWGPEEDEDGGEEGGAAPLVVVVGDGTGAKGSGRSKERRTKGGGAAAPRRGGKAAVGQPSLLSRWRSGWGRAWAKKPPAGGGAGHQPAGAEDCSSCPPPLFILAVSIVEVTLYLWVGASDASVEGVTLSGFPPPASLAPPLGPPHHGTVPAPPPLHQQHPPSVVEDHDEQHRAPPPPGSQLRRFLLYDPHRRREAWRFATYMLLHTGALHLALNVAIQAVLAVPLEAEQGHLRTGLVYIGGGLGGSLSTSMLEPEIYIVGASGGVYALLISQLANVFLNFRRLRYKAYRAVAVAVISLADVSFNVYHFVRRGNECPRIGWAAHTGGALAGLLIGLVLFRSDEGPAGGALAQPANANGDPASSRRRGGRRRPPPPALIRWRRALGPHQAARWAAGLTLCAFVTAAVVTNALHPDADPLPRPESVAAPTPGSPV